MGKGIKWDGIQATSLTLVATIIDTDTISGNSTLNPCSFFLKFIPHILLPMVSHPHHSSHMVD